MTDIDLSRLPRGELGRRALLDYVLSSDDRVERYFLEVKSAVDLNAKAGRAKVAKFILGAANRDPVKAAKRFEGHALMLLGVGNGTAPGIPAFEAKDLSGDVRKFIGADGPGWDFERIPVDSHHDVILVIADPPDGQPWTCRADGAEGLTDGAIYIRDDGSTRQASGDEIRQLIARSQASTQPIDVGVELDGELQVITVDEQVIVQAVRAEAKAMLASVERKRSSAHPLLAASVVGITTDRRSVEDFREDVETWVDAVVDDPMAGIRDLVAALRAGIRLRVMNHGRKFLKEVQVELEFDAPVTAIAWEPYDKDDLPDLLPGRPQAWGSDIFGIGRLGDLHSSSLAGRGSDGVLRIVQSSPARMTLFLNDLRPRTTVLTDDDDVVLIICPADGPMDLVTGRWRLTAADFHDVVEGEVVVDTNFLDMGEAVAGALSPASRSRG